MKAENGLKKCSKCGEFVPIDIIRAHIVSGSLVVCCNRCFKSLRQHELADKRISDMYELKESILKNISIHSSGIQELETTNTSCDSKKRTNIKNTGAYDGLPDSLIRSIIKSRYGLTNQTIQDNFYIIDLYRTITKTKRLCKTLKSSENV